MDFDFKKLFTENLPSLLTWLKDSLLGSLNGLFGGFGSLLMSVTGLGSKASEKLDEVGDKILENQSPNLKTARDVLIERVSGDDMYKAIAKKAGIAEDSPALGSIRSILVNTSKSFLASGAPALKNGTPTAAVKAAKEAYDKIVPELQGVVDEKTAHAIAACFTGVNADANEFLAANMPQTGLVAMLGAAQTALAADQTITADSLPLKIDAGALGAQKAAAQVVANNQTNIGPAKNTTGPTAMPPGSKPQAPLVAQK